MKYCILILTVIATSLSCFAQGIVSPYQHEIFWQLSPLGGIHWSLADESRLPHADHIEMSGQRVSAIVRYRVDEQKQLHLERQVIYPQLRVFIQAGQPDWFRYRAYLQATYTDDLLPALTVAQRRFVPGPLAEVHIDGKLKFTHLPQMGLALERTLLPSMTDRLLVEKWTISNVGDTARTLRIGQSKLEQAELGLFGPYRRRFHHDGRPEVSLSPGQSYSFALYFSASLNEEPDIDFNFTKIETGRDSFLSIIRRQLVLHSPDSMLNTLFYFSKIRAAESIFHTEKMGLVHSPGGGRYYTGVWANDQAEYSGPFFPYLGYDIGNEAAMNAYRMFQRNIPPEGQKIWASFEMGGELPCCSKDRGDAAMIAFGAGQYALALGDADRTRELWPLIEWALAYNEGKKNNAGVIDSDSDEMEGRLPTGTANLSTSSLYYGALLQAAYLAEALGKPKSLAKDYRARAAALQQAIERYFGANIEGLQTYKYFAEHQALRNWIALPLVMDIDDRKAGTLDALFDKLWTDNGVVTEYDPNSKSNDVYWDRGTLYAFRGAFRAGAADRGLEKLRTFSRTRLLGFHVPYVVEAWPEGGMAHLSAESALYCRIFTEGMLGITPTGFRSFTFRPQLPSEWPFLQLREVNAFGATFAIDVRRLPAGRLEVIITKSGKEVLRKRIGEGEVLSVKL